MTTFAELRTLVGLRTGRPDLAAHIDMGIRTATVRAHHTDFFWKDAFRGYVTYTPVSGKSYVDIPNFTSDFPLFRALKTVYCVDIDTDSPVEKLTYRTMGDEYDEEGRLRPSIYVLAGGLRIYPRVQTGKLELLGYNNPNVGFDTYSSWIADLYKDEIAAWASGIVFARSGALEQAQEIQRMHVVPFKEQLIESHLLGDIN